MHTAPLYHDPNAQNYAPYSDASLLHQYKGRWSRGSTVKIPDENPEKLAAQTYTAGSGTSQLQSFNARNSSSNIGPAQAPSPYQIAVYNNYKNSPSVEAANNKRAESSARPQKQSPQGTGTSGSARPSKRPTIPVPNMFRRK